MRNCPSAVPGAKTTFAPTSDGVELTITSPDPAAVARITQLAHLQSVQRDPVWFVRPHTGMHGGPGSLGYCPIIHADTNITYQPIADGVRIHVRARSKDRVGDLQAATDARVRGLARPAS